jgi:hypothetical protein
MVSFIANSVDVIVNLGAGASESGTSILAMFNVSGRQIVELVPLASFPGTLDSFEYVVRAHTTGLISQPIKTIDGALITANIPVRSFEIFSAYPLQHLDTASHGTVGVCSLGLLGKMTGCAAITSSKVIRRENGTICAETSLKALGVMGK